MIPTEIAYRDKPLRPHPDLNHTPHHDQMFEAAFLSDDDEVIADVICAWIVGTCTPAGSFVRYFAKRMEKTSPLSPRLRQATIRAICRIRDNELTASVLETIRLLHYLNADIDDVENGADVDVEKEADVGDLADSATDWVVFLVGVIRSPTGFESLSSHYWHLLGKLTSTTYFAGQFSLRDMEVMRSLEEVEDWEKLGVWMAAVWQSLPLSSEPTDSMEDIERVTLKLASRQLSALQKFEDLCKRRAIWDRYETTLQEICSQARAELSTLEPTPPL